MGFTAGHRFGDRTALRIAGVIAAGVMLACIAGLLVPASAHAAAVFTAATPTPGTTLAAAPGIISVYADDASALVSATLTLNGTNIAMGIENPGHWVDPVCEETWVVDDYTAGTLYYYPSPPLLEGSYEATVTLTTQSSGTSTYHWHFAIEWPPGSEATFSSRAPSAGSTITAPSTISFRADSPNSLANMSRGVYLDGTALTTYVPSWGAKYLNVVTNTLAPTDGVHTVIAWVTDTLGIQTQDTWSFNTAIPPTLASPTPSGGGTMSGQRPAIGLTITDNSPGQMHVRMLLDGTEVYHGSTAQGAFSYTPTSDLALNATHSVLVEATDVAGNTSSTTWTFSGTDVFSSPTPAAGTIPGSPGYVHITVDSGLPILAGSQLYLDGTAVTTAVNWPGHYEDPDCEAIWVVDDYTNATLSAATGVLMEGVHTVRAVVQKQGGGTATYEWSFTIDYPEGSAAQFTNKSPAPGATITGTANLSFRIQSVNTISYANVAVYIDGTRTNATVSPYSGTLEYVSVPYTAFTSRDGLHTVRVTVLDNIGVYSEDTWSFTTQLPPTVSEQYPANGGTMSEARGQIGLKVADNVAGNVRLRLTLDGTVVHDAWIAQGTFRWAPSSDYIDGKTYPVVAQVWDAAGNTVSSSWSFKVVAGPAMADATKCTACHTTFPGAHPFNDCGGCHQDDPLYDPHGPNRYAPLGACFNCHGTGYAHPSSSVADCLYCHTNESWTGVPRHTSAEVETSHAVTSAACGATGCHPGTLTAVHAPFPKDSAFKNQCATCHTSANATVKAAIAANDKRCETCHPEADPHHRTADVTALANGEQACSVCHRSSITAEHMKPTSSSAAAGCNACHAAGGARSRITGEWDRTCTTTGCHDAAGAQPVHTNYCFACHDVSQPDFSTAKTAFPAVTDVNRDTACKACHAAGLVGAHPYHQAGANCGLACHPGWGTSLAERTPLYSDPLSGASFATASSKATPAAVLHTIHATPRWPSALTTEVSACSSCHATAACNACHTGAIPATHAQHSSTDQDANPAWTGVVCYGVAGGDQTQRSSFRDTNQCASAGCHDIASSASSAPRSVEDYNYAVGGNPDDPTASNSAITLVGSWRYRASSVYTGGRMSYSNLAGTSLTATFSGARIEIVSDRDPYRGQANVYIDGALAGSFDGYSPVTRHQAIVFTADLAPGTHTVSVRPTGVKGASARGAFVVVDAFKVYATQPQLYKPTCASCHPDRSQVHY